MWFILIAALFFSTQAVEEQLPPLALSIIPQSRFNGAVTIIDSNCGSRQVQRNDRNFEVRVCIGSNSILTDGNIGEYNVTDGLQANELQTVYTWNARRTPEFPFLLYAFRTSVTITRIVITFILSPNDAANKVPIITMFVSNTDPSYPTQAISVNYDASDAPDAGVYQLNLVPNVSESFMYWCIDMEPPDGTNYIIVSEVELYQEVQIGTPVTTSLAVPTTTAINPVTSRLVVVTTTSSTSIQFLTSLTSEATASTTSSSTVALAVSTTSPSTVAASTIPTTSPSTVASTASTSPSPAAPTTSFVGSSQKSFEFLQPQQNSVIYAVTPDRKESVKLNCTVFYNGSYDNLTITWTTSNKLIYTDTESDPESYRENYKITTILKVTGKSKATFTCNFHHSSGWNDSREFVFTTDEAASKDSEIPIVTLLAAAGGVLIFLIATIICLIVCCRCCYCKSAMRNKMKRVMVNKNNMPFARNQVNSLYDASNDMPDDVYYDKILYHTDNTSERHLDIYNIYDLAPNKTSNRISCNSNSDNSYENIYLESLNPEEMMTASQKIYSSDDDVNALLPYTSIYDNPAPLDKTEAPATVTWDNITPYKHLGNGQFGEVMLAITVNLSLKDLKLSSNDSNSDDDDKSNQTLVAIKTLKNMDDNEVQKAFENEIKFMARLDHVNVVKVLGICTTGVPFLMMEYMENGDLNSFLQKFRYSKRLVHADEIDLPILLYISLQIAYGMKYLATHKFVHRDLAARNCLVGRNFVVKVADFGMSQNLYSSHYFVLEGAAILPIRWMATESFYGKFSVKTDVWSYGVTLWEIFTLCQSTPYDEMNDQQIIIDVMLGAKRSLLAKPDICPDEVYDIMLRCFKHEAKQRANFNELYDKLYKMYTKYNET